MSGGSYDYAYYKVQDMAQSLANKTQTPLRRAFAKHLKLVAEAMHDIEWVDSGDCGPGDEEQAIRAVLGDKTRALELDILIEEAKELIEKLQKITSL